MFSFIAVVGGQLLRGPCAADDPGGAGLAKPGGRAVGAVGVRLAALEL